MQALNIPHTVPAARFDDDEARWAAVQARDARADDVFFYSVRTTGVYCRPSCAARPARRENVAFHASQAAAVAAGFRACKRCQPDQAPRAAGLVGGDAWRRWLGHRPERGRGGHSGPLL